MNLLRLSKFKFIFIQGHITKTRYFTTIMLKKKLTILSNINLICNQLTLFVFLICQLHVHDTWLLRPLYLQFREITSKPVNG